MSGDFIVGFTPVPAGAGKTVPALAVSSQGGRSPVGLFGALLGLVTPAEPSVNLTEPAMGLPVPAASPAEPAVQLALAGAAAFDAATTGLFELPQPQGVELVVEAPAEPQPDGDALLADLVDAIAALDTAQANGEPPSPVLTQKLVVTLDAIAGLLGITLPAEPAVDPAIVAAAIAAAPVPDAAPGEIEPQLELAAEPGPALETQSLFVPVLASVASAAPAVLATPQAALPTAADIPPASTPMTVAGVGALPQIEAVPQLPPAPQPAPAVTGDEVAIDPASDLGLLVKKIGEFAETIEPHSPGLARRLDALVQKLTSGEVSTQTLAELGIDADQSLTDLDLDQALQHLLAGPVVKGAPVPQAFAAAELKLPEIIVLPPKAKAVEPSTPPARAAMPAPQAGPDAGLERTPQLTQAPLGPEVADRAEQKPATPSGQADPVKTAAAKPEMPVEPATKIAAAKPEVPVEPATQPATQAAPPPTAIVAGTKAIHAAYQAPVHQINIPQMAFEVVRQVQAGNSRFQIRLDPPDLGRIDVKLDMDGSGNVNARMTVERAETLDLMQRDQRALERALAQAGLDSSKTNLEFSLRQNPFGREDGGDGRGHRPPFGTGGGDAADLGELPAEQSQTQHRGSASAGGVNLFV